MISSHGGRFEKDRIKSTVSLAFGIWHGPSASNSDTALSFEIEVHWEVSCKYAQGGNEILQFDVEVTRKLHRYKCVLTRGGGLILHCSLSSTVSSGMSFFTFHPFFSWEFRCSPWNLVFVQLTSRCSWCSFNPLLLDGLRLLLYFWKSSSIFLVSFFLDKESPSFDLGVANLL